MGVPTPWCRLTARSPVTSGGRPCDGDKSEWSHTLAVDSSGPIMICPILTAVSAALGAVRRGRTGVILV